MMMTDYNDGNWHGWNGGDCPVHPKSMVEGFWLGAGGYAVHNKGAAIGMNFKWDGGAALQTFRVVTPYVEPPKPRELWINEYPGGTRAVHDSPQDAAKARGSGWMPCKTTRWIEVLE